jgi:L-amino acid N-acyltransferase YncA/ribosomal protein S18 acetylase RimI-like enzyme
MTSAITACVSTDELEQFWAEHRVPSGDAWRQAGSNEDRARLAGQLSRRLFQEERSLKVAIRRRGTVAGLACLTPLDWDSEQFGFPAARVDVACKEEDRAQSMAVQRELLDQICDLCRRRSVCHLTARVDAGNLTTIHALEHAGFELIDGIQTFSARLPVTVPPATTAFEIRLYRDEDLSQILDIARTAYVFDRFHADASLSASKADRVNETWVRNCCLGRMADAVIVASSRNAVVGYVTCKIDAEATRTLSIGCGVIGMVATAASSRTAGVALAATRGALDWFQERGVAVVEVGTQLRNVGAGRLYERSGFRLARVSLTFRKWINDWSMLTSGGFSHAI